MTLMSRLALVTVASALGVSLSQTASASTQLVVTLDGESLTINDYPLSGDEVEVRLRDIFQTRADKTLYLRATGGTGYGESVRVLASALSAGAERLVLLSADPGVDGGLPVELGNLRRVPTPVRLPRAEYFGRAETPRGIILALDSVPTAGELRGQLDGRRGEAAKVWVLADADTRWSRLLDLMHVCQESQATGLVLVVEKDLGPAGSFEEARPSPSPGGSWRLLDFALHAGIATVMSLVAVCAIGLFAAVAILGLRFLRRGPARFWLAPGYVVLTLLPVAVGACTSGWGVVRTIDVISRVGSEGGGAIRAGLMEAQVPLLVGVIVTFGLSLLAFALLAFGRRPAATSPSPERLSALGVVMPAALAFFTVALALAVPFAADAVTRGSEGAVTLARATVFLGALVAVAAVAAVIILVLRAPRGAAPGAMRIVAVGAPAAVGLLAFVATVGGFAWMDRSADAMIRGVPLEEPDSGELPQVYVPQGTPELAAPTPPPPPPPPPPRPRTAPRPKSRQAPAPVEPVRIGGGIVAPKKLRHVNPEYPDIAKQARVQGIVILECTVNPEGKVSDVKVLRGIPLLDQAAIDAVKQWEYTPTRLNGVPVPIIMTVTVSFKLS